MGSCIRFQASFCLTCTMLLFLEGNFIALQRIRRLIKLKNSFRAHYLESRSVVEYRFSGQSVLSPSPEHKCPLHMPAGKNKSQQHGDSWNHSMHPADFFSRLQQNLSQMLLHPISTAPRLKIGRRARGGYVSDHARFSSRSNHIECCMCRAHVRLVGGRDFRSLV
jgi:hypothetical protein